MINRPNISRQAKSLPITLIFAIVLFVKLSSTPTSACNIPVFRYALERWKPDVCRLLVFYSGAMTKDAHELVSEIKTQSFEMGGPLNLSIELIDVSRDVVGEASGVWGALKSDEGQQLPYAALLSKIGMGKTITQWHGPLNKEAFDTILPTKSSDEIVQRLLAGDSVVWLLIRGSDDSKNRSSRKLLVEALADLEKKIRIPDGVGLPGSELFSELPLLIQFRVIELDASRPDDVGLCQLFRAIRPDASDSPLVVPVFGKARALEVVPAESIDKGLIEDLTLFLCGACSCQVKERNPGFDLLVSARWHKEIFGENSDIPEEVTTLAREPSNPRKLSIPPGRNK